MGRVFNVFGSPIDRKGSLGVKESRSIHQSSPPISKRITTSEIFETGTKETDVLSPLECDVDNIVLFYIRPESVALVTF
ncbi:MAG TPA: hypothetical protein HA349_10365 [Methanotrichaceae archaeon]|nr:hypothetical protein [Methanotrichaceae archaeon]